MIAVVLEMSGIPSLAFAVGVYLPLSSSSPIFIGGLIRWLVDRWLRREKFQHKNLTPEELTAEGDKSSGVLLASGYIAGGALTGILIALMEFVPAIQFQDANRGVAGGEQSIFPRAEFGFLSLLPFAVLCVLLYLVGRDVLLAAKARRA